MRVGQNPAKALKEVVQPAEITAAITTYIPFVSGYYQSSLEVLKRSLESLRAHADLPFDLMVFDNGSCGQVRDYLLAAQQAGKIQYLILSEENIGVIGAWNVIFGAAHGKFITYSDYDIYFYPKWLSGLIEILKTYPEAGMVTGMPLLSPSIFSSSTIEWAENTTGAELERGKLVKWEDVWRHSQSIGTSEADGKKYYQEHPSSRVSYQGKTCFVGAGHFQFAGRKEYFEKITPLFAEKPMGGEVRKLDIAINEHGYLRLCTPDWHVEHMGNTLQDRFELKSGDAELISTTEGSSQNRKSWLNRNAIIRRILVYLYDRIFKLLYEG